MKFLKHILLTAFILSASLVVAQNKKITYPPPAPQNLPPEAYFSWINACKGDSTCFINQTIRGQTYTWTVIGHNTHGAPVPIFTSTNDSGFCYLFPAGNFSVSLTAYNNHYSAITKPITVDTTTKAAFTFIHCSNNFSNTSKCASSFYWDFGDGTHSTLAIPNHRYADTGHYNVTLIVYKGTVTDTMKQQIFVDVESFASANFTSTVSNDTVFVHAAYSGTGVNYYWTWGPGIYSTGKDTFHVYKDSTASYPIQLFIINSCGPVSHSDTVQIIKNLHLPAVLDFSNSNLSIVPNPVTNNDYVEGFYNAYTDNNYLAQVYNALGQKVFEAYFAFQSGLNGFKINTSGFSTGMYVMVLQSGNSFIRKKFYITRTP